MNNKILTIIVPTYNMERYLDKCLMSLVVTESDLFQKLEILVIIDGATDCSSQIAHSYQDRFPDVFVTIDKENGNYGSCINKGLEIATGKYVKVLDADDSFDTSNFEDYLRFLNSVEVDMVITPYTIVDETGKEKSRETYDLPVNTLLTWEQLTPAFKKKSLQMHAVTYKRQNLIDIHYRQTEGISYTDQEWIFTPLTAVNTAIAYPITIYKYLVGRQGQTINSEVFKRSLSHNELCCRRIVKDYKSFDSFESAKQEFIDYKFQTTISSMYRWILLCYPDSDMSQLVAFDDFIRENDSSYIDVLDEQKIKHTQYKYIKHWHRNGRKRSNIDRLCFLYSLGVDKIQAGLRRINKRGEV